MLKQLIRNQLYKNKKKINKDNSMELSCFKLYYPYLSIKDLLRPITIRDAPSTIRRTPIITAITIGWAAKNAASMTVKIPKIKPIAEMIL